MSDADYDKDQYAATLDSMQRANITAGELWLYYISMGGSTDEFEINAYLHGMMRLPAIDRDMLSQSVNELYDDICRSPRAPFSTDLESQERNR
ncbi:hypothetical protein [Arthrobacter sp. MDT3-44]